MKVLYDSNVLVKYLAGYEEARVLVEKAARGEWEGYITDVVASETIYVYLRLALSVSRYELRELVARQDARIRDLLKEDVAPLLSLFKVVAAEATVEELLDLVASYGLLPNDALIVAAALRHGINTVATFDEDFKRVPWLRVLP